MSSESESENKPASNQSTSKALWKVHSQLTKGQECLGIFNRYPQPITTKSGLKDLITETETSLGYTIPNAYSRFKQTINPNDPKDKLNLNKINFKAFIRRMGNLVLEEIYKAKDYDKTLVEFILDVNGEENKEPDIESSSNEKSEKESDSDMSFHELSKVGESVRKDLENGFDVSEISEGKRKNNSESEDSEKNRSRSNSSKNSIYKSKTFKKSEKSERSEKSFSSNKSKRSIQSKKSNSRKSSNSSKSDNEEKSLEKSFQKPPESKPPIVKTIKKPAPAQEKNPTIPKDSSGILPKSRKVASKVPTKPPISSSVSNIKKRPDSSSSSSSSPSKSSLFNLNLSEQAIKEVRQGLSNKPKKSPKAQKPDSFSSIFLTNISIENAKKAWFSLQIKGKEIEFKKLFVLNSKEYLTPKDLPIVFESSLLKLSISPHKHHKDWFKSIVDAFHPVKKVQKLGSKSKILSPKISFMDFIEIMNVWGEKFIKEQDTVIGNLVNSISQYKELSESHPSFPDLQTKTQVLSIKLQKTLENYLKTHKDHSILIEKYKKTLEDLFQFYTRVQRIQGTGDTFEEMEANNTNLSLPKFLKFCSDFDLVLAKGEEKRGLIKEDFINIFKKTANNTRLMSQAQFIEALDKITEILYTPELDKLLGTDLALKDMDEKRELLFKHLELDKFSKYHSKKKAFGIAFSPEKYSRIPQTESSQQYKFKISEENLKKLEHWKKTKNNRDSPQLLNPIKEVSKAPQVVIKKTSSKKLPVSGYAQKSKIKKPSIKVEEKAESFEESSEIHSEKGEQESSSARIITIKALNSLKYHDLDSEFSLKDLITEDSDEFFDKLYGIEPNLQKIMKMHDEKLARGQKVVEKNKYRLN